MRTIDKILLQLLVTPTTLAATVGGLMTSMVAWSFDSNTGLLAGLACFLVGCGIAGTRAIFTWEDVLADKAKADGVARWEARHAALKALHQTLGQCRDREAHELSAGLLGLYEAFHQPGPQVEGALRIGIAAKVESLFDGCLQYLTVAHQNRRTARKLREADRGPLLAQRDKLLEEVSEAMVKLSQAVHQTQGTPTGQDTGELDRLSDSLDTQLLAQRRIAERHPLLVRMLRDQ